MYFRRIILHFALLNILRWRRGQYMSRLKSRMVKRLLVFDHLKRENRRLMWLVAQAINSRRPRRWHVRHIFRGRKIYGAWYSLIPVMREHDREEYFRFFRMTPESFDYILEKLGPIIQKHSKRESISPGERLAVTLRFLASGDSFYSLSYLFRISSQCISNIVLETTAAIWFVLRDEVFEVLSEEFWRRKAAEFEAMWQFPMCIGAVDGRHCFVQKFPMRGSEYHNYKGTHSVVLFAVSDAKYKFIIADAGARGRESDGGIFERSVFGKKFNENRLRIPPAVLSQQVDDFLPYVLVGDDAFALHEHMMKPFEGGLTMPPEETIFNYRLSRARRVVENAFGILTARFRVLRRTMIVNETLAQNVILSAVALHNLHLMREDSIPPKQRVYLPEGYADTYQTDGILKPGRWRNSVKHVENSIFSRLAQQRFVHGECEEPILIREKFLELFIADPVPWQWDLLP